MTNYSTNTNYDSRTTGANSIDNMQFTTYTEYYSGSTPTNVDPEVFVTSDNIDALAAIPRLYKSMSISRVTRGFILLTDDAILPTRGTRKSAGYDFYIPKVNGKDVTYNINPGEIIKIKSDVAAFMGENEVLCIHIRSSVGIKKNCSLPNCTGIIDSDYYMNPDNKGNIILAIRNDGTEPVTFKSGDKIAQGIFMNYLTADNDKVLSEERLGGVGSTGK